SDLRLEAVLGVGLLRLVLMFFGAAVGLALAAPALAADEESQVYMDEMSRPGQFGLDLHNNYVISGDGGLDYPGQMSSLHRYRLTPEWSYGLSKEVELGLYLPLT